MAAASTPSVGSSSSGTSLDPTQQDAINAMKQFADQQALFSVKMTGAKQDLDGWKQVNNS